MNRPASRCERGHAALPLSLAIVVAASVIGAGVVDVGLADARRIAADSRRQEAQAVAEDALDRAVMWLQLNASRVRSSEPGGWMEPGRERWQVCDDAVPGAPCTPQGRGEIETFDARWSAYGPLPWLFAPSEQGTSQAAAYYVARAHAPGEAMPGWSTVHVIAEARSRDDIAHARVRRSFQLRPLLRRAPPAPLVTTGTAALEGAVSIVAPAGVAAQATAAGSDALTLAFGSTSPEALRRIAQVYDDCAALGSASTGLHWIRGACVLGPGGAIGSSAAPVLLVVESGDVRIEGPTELFGMLVLRSNVEGVSRLQQGDGAGALHGALVAERDLQIVGEDFSLHYEADVLTPLLQLAGPPIEVPGSWTDHR